MTTGLDKLYEDLGSTPSGGAVLRRDNTIGHRPDIREEKLEFTGEGLEKLFGGTQAYHVIKNENPAHRWMLWLTVKGLNKKEIAATTGYCYATVATVSRQDWFRRALVSVLNEMGRAEAETFIKGQEMASFTTMVEIRDDPTAEKHVRLNAADKILDRIRGKPIAKTEVKQETTIDVAVHDAATLLAERAENEKKLKANGLLGGSN